MTQRRAEHRPSRLPDARTSRSGSRWGRSPGWYPAEGLSCSSLRRVPGAARRAGTRSPNPTPSRTRRRRRLASQPRRRRRPRRPRWLPPRPRKTRLPKVRVREGPRPLGGASETRVPGLRPSSSGRTLGGQPTGRAASASEACAWGLRGGRLWAPRRPEGRGAARGDPRGAISAAEGGAARRGGLERQRPPCVWDSSRGGRESMSFRVRGWVTGDLAFSARHLRFLSLLWKPRLLRSERALCIMSAKASGTPRLAGIPPPENFWSETFG